MVGENPNGKMTSSVCHRTLRHDDTHQGLLIGVREIKPQSKEDSLKEILWEYINHCDSIYSSIDKCMDKKLELERRAKALLADRERSELEKSE